MAARTILELGNDTLRLASKPAADRARARTVMRDLEDTLNGFRTRHGFGRGISAIQIGEPLRLIFLDTAEGRHEMVNPALRWKSPETFTLWDDCFSFPDLMVRLARHCRVRVEYQDLEGRAHALEAEGSLSELIQHEMDHLDGILAVDHARSGRDFATRAEWRRQQSCA